MSALTKKYIDDLRQGVVALFASDRWTEYLDFVSRFHNYSVNNIISIFNQFPDAKLVASFTDWKRNNRIVKKGETGIRIIAPHQYKDIDANGNERKRTGFHLAYCFDVSQTTGEELPEPPCHKLTADVDGYADIMRTLVAVSPVPIYVADIEGSANGYYNSGTEEIVVKAGMSELQTLKTTVHELAHCLLHCADGEESEASRSTKEVEAESVAYAVCRHLGLDTSDYSFGYLASWSTGRSDEQLRDSMDVIVRTADKIIKMIDEYEVHNA